MQLSQHYAVALRRRAKAESSLNRAELFDANMSLSQEIEKKVMEERNAAYARMTFHRENCRICNEKA
jgi:hypothetical protein